MSSEPLKQQKMPAVSAGRRSALRLLLGSLAASIAATLYPVLRYLVPPAESNSVVNAALAGTIRDLKPNSAKTFHFGNRPALLVCLPNGEYRSMTAVCTHLGCTVQYRPDGEQIWCACHNGCYDVNGRNVSGPPPRPLERYEVHVRGEEIFVSRKQDA